jgi:hypothetical protein
VRKKSLEESLISEAYMGNSINNPCFRVFSLVAFESLLSSLSQKKEFPNPQKIPSRHQSQ